MQLWRKNNFYAHEHGFCARSPSFRPCFIEGFALCYALFCPISCALGICFLEGPQVIFPLLGPLPAGCPRGLPRGCPRGGHSLKQWIDN